ncbi:MAG TPA: peptide-methionine (R)-S-oxide reductase MsrB [Nitrospiria bacterium]
MERRSFIQGAIGAVAGVVLAPFVVKKTLGETQKARSPIVKIRRSKREWKKLLSPEQFRVLREEGTEKPFTSPLLKTKEKGVYVCAGCELELFTSDMKYESGTGWPSFFTTIPGRLETKKDFKLLYPRTEYHCARCEGHQGHVFNDGPPPTRQRWCNNGIALKFRRAAG